MLLVSGFCSVDSSGIPLRYTMFIGATLQSLDVTERKRRGLDCFSRVIAVTTIADNSVSESPQSRRRASRLLSVEHSKKTQTGIDFSDFDRRMVHARSRHPDGADARRPDGAAFS